MKPGEFGLILWPILPPGDDPIQAVGYIRPGIKGRISVPRVEGKEISIESWNGGAASGYFPLMKELGDTVTVGSQEWNHIVTKSDNFKGSFAFRWSRNGSDNQAGTISCLSCELYDQACLEAVSGEDSSAPEDSDPLFRKPFGKGDVVSIPSAHGGMVECDLIVKGQQAFNYLAKIAFSTGDVPFEELPGCQVIRGDLRPILDGKESFARFFGLQDIHLHAGAGG